jgi:hypothetical protein
MTHNKKLEWLQIRLEKLQKISNDNGIKINLTHYPYYISIISTDENYIPTVSIVP